MGAATKAEDNKCVVTKREIRTCLINNKQHFYSRLKKKKTGTPCTVNCRANSNSTVMRLDIYEQQEVATGAKQITSSVVG